MLLGIRSHLRCEIVLSVVRIKRIRSCLSLKKFDKIEILTNVL